MTLERLQATLMGRNKGLSKRYLGVTVLLFLLGYLLNYLPVRDFFPLMIAIFVLMGVLPAIQAYQNDGLLLSWLLASAPIFTFISGVRYGPASPENPVLYAAGTALAFGAIPGGVGFLIGVGARRLQTRRGEGGRPPKREEKEPTSLLEGLSNRLSRKGIPKYLLHRRVAITAALLVGLWSVNLTTGVLSPLFDAVFAPFFAMAPNSSIFENLMVSFGLFALWWVIYILGLAVVLSWLYERLRYPQKTTDVQA